MKHDCDSAETAASGKVAGSECSIGSRALQICSSANASPAMQCGALLFLA